MHKLVPRLVLIAAAGMLFACADDSRAPTAASSANPLLARLAAAGFDTVGVIDGGDHLVVEGDIGISKEEVASFPLPFDGMQPLFHYRVTNPIAPMNTYRIHVNIDSLGSGVWVTPALNAISSWNGAQSGVYFTYETDEPPELTIVFRNLSGAWGRGLWPKNGNVGDTIYLDPDGTSELTADQKRNLIAHEIGHTLGLRHTNWYAYAFGSSGRETRAGSDNQGGVHIPNTPVDSGANADPNSVMNKGNGGEPSAWAGFSAHDLTAIRTLYPFVYAVWMATPSLIVAHEPPMPLTYYALTQAGATIPGKKAWFHTTGYSWAATADSNGVTGHAAGNTFVLILVDGQSASRDLEVIDVTISGADTVAATDSVTYTASISGWGGPYAPTHWVSKKDGSGNDIPVCPESLTCTFAASDITIGGVRLFGTNWHTSRFKPVVISP